MMDKIDKIYDSFSSGAIRTFVNKDSSYIYFAESNTSYEISNDAYYNLKLISEGLAPGSLPGFWMEWDKVTRSNVQKRNAITVLRTYINKETSLSWDQMRSPTVNKVENVQHWEVYLELSDPQILPHMLDQIKLIWKSFKVKTYISLKAPIAVVLQNWTTIRNNKLFCLITDEDGGLTSENLAKIVNLDYLNLLIKQKSTAISGLNRSLRNFVILNDDIDEISYPYIKALFLRELSDDKFRIPEHFSNLLRVYNYLTSGRVARTSIGHITTSESSQCRTCWARNICWSTAFYETFNSSPLEMAKNPLKCNILFQIIEVILHGVNAHQKEKFLENNSPRFFDIGESEILTLLNP